MSSVALFPLHHVLYPGGELPLKIFEARYLDLVSACLREDIGFGVAPISKGHEVGVPAETHPVGTIARINAWDRGEDGLLRITATGTARFRINSIAHRANGLVDAEITWFEDGDDSPLPAEFAHFAAIFESLWQRITPRPRRPGPLGSRSLCYRLAELLPLPFATRVGLLSEPSADVQLRLLDGELREMFR